MASSIEAPTCCLHRDRSCLRTLTSLPPRNHTLTPPLSAESPIKSNGPPSPPTPPTSLPQTQSPLLSLPLELRLQIYTDLLGGPDVPVHIVRTRTGFASIRCWMPHERTTRHGCLGTIEPMGLFVGWMAVKWHYDIDDEGRMMVGMQGMLPLLQTCRFIYAEAIVPLYKTPVFMINGMDTLLGWRECVLAKRFAAVRALDLRVPMGLKRLQYRRDSAEDMDWQGFWRAGGGMEGLRWLRVTLGGRAKRFSWEDEMEVLEPLEQLRQVPDFEVLESGGIYEDGESSALHERKQRPFKLVRSAPPTPWGDE